MNESKAPEIIDGEIVENETVAQPEAEVSDTCEQEDATPEENKKYTYFIVERILASAGTKTELKRYLKEKGLAGKIIRGKIMETTEKVRTEIIF